MGTLPFALDRIATPIGIALVVSDDQDRLRAVDWDDCDTRMNRLLDRHYGAGRWTLRSRTSGSRCSRAIEAYFAGDLSAPDSLVVATGGTPFQRQVWAALRDIPVGTTLTYSELAAVVRRPSAVRAVGTANGANPVGIVVPCHRVIGADGSLTGYAGGLARKRWLLVHERATGVADGPLFGRPSTVDSASPAPGETATAPSSLSGRRARQSGAGSSA